MRNLLLRYDGLLNHKRNVENPDNYYHYVTVSYKVKKSLLGTGAFPHKKTKYRDELRFDGERQARDLDAVNNQISQCAGEIEHTIAQTKAAIDQVSTSNSANSYNIGQLQSKLQNFTAQYGVRADDNVRLESQIRSKNAELIAKQQQQTTASQEIQQSQNLINQASSEKTNLQNSIAQAMAIQVQAQSELAEANSALYAHLQSLNDQDRAKLLSETYNDEYQEALNEMIFKLGFDAGALASFGIEKGSKDLLELALAQDVDFSAYKYNGKILLQQLIDSHNKELLDFVLSVENQDFGVILNDAIDRNDLATLEIILGEHQYIASSLHKYGHSLLHTAIATNKIEIAQFLITLDPGAIGLKSTFDETAFKVALRQNDSQVLQSLLPFINLEQEISYLQASNSTALLANLGSESIQLNGFAQNLLQEYLLQNNENQNGQGEHQNLLEENGFNLLGELDEFLPDFV